MWPHLLADLASGASEHAHRTTLSLSVAPALLPLSLQWVSAAESVHASGASGASGASDAGSDAGSGAGSDAVGAPLCAEFLLAGWLRPYLDALLANVEVANAAKMQMVLTNWQILFGLVAVFDAAALPPLPRAGASAWDAGMCQIKGNWSNKI
jgi:hypothetical protein